jgi:hypothetical protein
VDSFARATAAQRGQVLAAGFTRRRIARHPSSEVTDDEDDRLGMVAAR